MRPLLLLTLSLVAVTTLHCSHDGSDPTTSFAPARRIPAEEFFRSPAAIDYRLSPDGRYLAFVGRYENHDNLYVRRIGEAEARRLTSSTDRDVNRFGWASNERIVYLQDNGGDENYRLYGIDLGDVSTVCYTDLEGVRTTFIDRLSNDPDRIIIGMNRHDPEMIDPYLLHLETGELTQLAENPGNVRQWVADNSGVIRIAMAETMLYRDDANAEFREVLSLGPDETFSPRYFTPDNRNVYAYSNLGRDTIAIVEFDLDAGKEVRTLFEHPSYDAFGDDERDHFYYSPLKERLIYALYTGERRELHFFDDDARRLHASIRRQLGDHEIVIGSASDDFTRLIVEASSDRMPGAYYLFDAASGELQRLHEAAPWLEEDDLAAMEPIEFRARDGLPIHGYLTLPRGVEPERLPVVVNPHAGPQWRNSWGYDAKAQFLANRGYAVLHVNFRGSEGYGKEFLRAGFKQWGLKIQDDITDGVNWLIDQGIADPERIAILGWSFGGYAALAGVTFTPELYACGVDLWGISNYFTLYEGFPSYWKPFLEEINQRWGDPVADRQQMHETSPVFHVERIKAPLFIAQGENDSRVRRSQSEQLIAELEKHGKEYEYMLIEGEGHAFSDERKTIELMSRIEAFLAKHMSPDPPQNHGG